MFLLDSILSIEIAHDPLQQKGNLTQGKVFHRSILS